MKLKTILTNPKILLAIGALFFAIAALDMTMRHCDSFQCLSFIGKFAACFVALEVSGIVLFFLGKMAVDSIKL